MLRVSEKAELEGNFLFDFKWFNNSINYKTFNK